MRFCFISFRKYVVLAFLLVCFGSCRKEEGTGGLATISGRVYAYDVDRLGNKTDSAYKADVRVFISYGNSTLVDDDTRTGFDGSFSFEWLNKGDYTLWVINECDTCHLGERSDLVKVTIREKKEKVQLPDLLYFY